MSYPNKAGVRFWRIVVNLFPWRLIPLQWNCDKHLWRFAEGLYSNKRRKNPCVWYNIIKQGLMQFSPFLSNNPASCKGLNENICDSPCMLSVWSQCGPLPASASFLQHKLQHASDPLQDERDTKWMNRLKHGLFTFSVRVKQGNEYQSLDWPLTQSSTSR